MYPAPGMSVEYLAVGRPSPPSRARVYLAMGMGRQFRCGLSLSPTRMDFRCIRRWAGKELVCRPSQSPTWRDSGVSGVS